MTGAVPHRDDLDVLVPTRDREAALAVTLSGLLAQDLTARLVLADQTPGAPIAERPEIASLLRVMRLRGWEVEVEHRTDPGRGITEQRQHLLDRARRTYLLMLDDDVLLERWVLAHLLDAIVELGCGFVGMAHAAASFLDDVRPAELETFELWPGQRVEAERVRKGSAAWERWRLHNAANVQHLLDRLPPGALDTRGWAAYKVGDRVRRHELWAGGSYIYTNVVPTLHLSHSFEVPDRSGVRLHDLVTVSLNNAGTIDHVVNDTGAAATPKSDGSNVVDLVAYPVG